MNARFQPSGPLRGSVTPPADKSISHRAALFGAMSDEPLTIHNYLYAEDTLSTLTAVRVLGAGVDVHEGNELVIRGVGLRGALESTGGVIDVGNAGTLLRLLPGWLAGQAGAEFTLTGDESIGRRPVDRIVEPLRAMGADITARDGRFTPLEVKGTELQGVTHDLSVASAQVKSCVLLAGLLAEGETRVKEPSPSRDHTERILLRSQARFTQDDEGVLRISQMDELEMEELTVPGDPSSAAFWLTAAAIVPGSRLVIEATSLNWTRAGFIRIAERMGAVVVAELEPVGTFTGEEPIGDLDIAASPLEGTEVTPEEVPLAIDELPLVALLGVFAEGDTVVRGAEELRVKESDRIAGVVEGLGGLGADIEATEDGFVVHGTGALKGGTIDSRGDHRMAMLGAVAGLASEEGVDVVGMEAASISYPSFEADLERLLAG